MIPVQGNKGQTIAVLGLGRSGLSAARALREGGAYVLAWDDGAAGREAAQSEGFEVIDLNRVDWSDIASLIVSPGIPHLYPNRTP